jgi:hypothetical protein
MGRTAGVFVDNLKVTAAERVSDEDLLARIAHSFRNIHHKSCGL